MRQARWWLEGLAALAVLAFPVSAIAQAPVVKEQPRVTPKAGLRAPAPRAVPLVPAENKPIDAHEASRAVPVAEQYCTAVLDAAREARFSHQAAELKALNDQLDARMAKIDERIA